MAINRRDYIMNGNRIVRQKTPQERFEQELRDTEINKQRENQAREHAIKLGNKGYMWHTEQGGAAWGKIQAPTPPPLAPTQSSASAPTTDGNNSNPAFSWNNEEMQKGMWQQAKDMSQLQLDNTLKTMGAASGYRSQELNLGDEITRRQNQQRFGFEKQLTDDNYAFRDRDRSERERANDEELERTYQMRTETTNSARQAASGAFFGGGNRFNARR